MVLMICLNPVIDRDDSIKTGLFATDTNLPCKLKNQTFKKILLTDATTEDGEDAVVKYFGVQKQWEKLLEQWYEEKKKSEVTSNITNCYFLSNHQVWWTMYGSASLRVCITTQQ